MQFDSKRTMHMPDNSNPYKQLTTVTYKVRPQIIINSYKN